MPRKTFRDPEKERPNLPSESKFDVKKIEQAERRASKVTARDSGASTEDVGAAQRALRAAGRVRKRQGLPERAAATQPGKPGKPEKMTTEEAFESIITGAKRAAKVRALAKKNIEDIKRASAGG